MTMYDLTCHFGIKTGRLVFSLPPSLPLREGCLNRFYGWGEAGVPTVTSYHRGSTGGVLKALCLPCGRYPWVPCPARRRGLLKSRAAGEHSLRRYLALAHGLALLLLELVVWLALSRGFYLANEASSRSQKMK